MIITKIYEQHDVPEALQAFVERVVQAPLPELTSLLLNHIDWGVPQGDLSLWKPALNRLDEILESHITKYGLDKETAPLHEVRGDDLSLCVAVLRFTEFLIDNSGNRTVYSSADRLYQLVSSPAHAIQLAALEVLVILWKHNLPSNHAKFGAPKSIRGKVLLLMNSFPPPVPAAAFDSRDKSGKPFLQLSCLDLLDQRTRYPSKWKALDFRYFLDGPALQKEQAKKSKGESTRNKSKQHSQKPAKTEGLASFTLSDENMRKFSMQQIYDLAMDSLPEEEWFEFACAAKAAKALNARNSEAMELREELLNLKLVALSYVSFVAPNELDPSILADLVEIIQPESATSVSKDVYFNALRALRCISLRRTWSGDLIRNLGGNVSHGVIFRCIRHIRAKIAREDEDCFEMAYVNLFAVIENMIPVGSMATRLAAGGLLKEMLEFFNTKSKYRWTCASATRLVILLVTFQAELMAEFVALGGFQKVIENIEYEVDFALQNPGHGGGPPLMTEVQHSISYWQAGFLHNMTQLATHLIDSQLGDRLRNVFDTTMLQSFNKILENNQVFGPLILGSAIDSIFFIIHNEPTAYQILKEANVIDTLLDNYAKLFMPSPDLLVMLTEVLGAVCLNKDGLQKVIDSKAIHTHFQLFFKVDFAKVLVTADMSTNLGCSFDELGRHYSSLKPVILEELKELALKLPGHVENSTKGFEIFDYESVSAEQAPNARLDVPVATWNGTPSAFMLDNFFFFLGGLIQDSGQWGKDAIKAIPFDIWLGFITLNNMPYDYTASNGFSTFLGILKYFDEIDTHYALRPTMTSLKTALEWSKLDEFLSYDSSPSFFSSSASSLDEKNTVAKGLNVLATVLFVLTDTYTYPENHSHERLHEILKCFGIMKEDFVSNLGLLLKQSILEEAKIRISLSDEDAMSTSPGFNTKTDVTPIVVYPKEPVFPISRTQETMRANKNALQLRDLMFRLQHYVYLIFGRMGDFCLHECDDQYNQNLDNPWRKSAVKITLEIGGAFKDLANDCGRVLELCGVEVFESYFLSATDSCVDALGKSDNIKATQLFTAMTFFSSGVLDTFLNYARRIVESLAELKEFDDLLSENAPISSKRYDILLNSAANVLQLFIRSCDWYMMNLVPNSRWFFCEGYDYKPQEFLNPSFVMQVKSASLGLLEMFHSVLSLATVLQPVITNRVIRLTKHVYNVQQSQGVRSFWPLDEANVFPPAKHTQFLKQCGLSDTAIHEYFLRYVVALTVQDDALERELGSEAWRRYLELIEDMKLGIEKNQFLTAEKFEQEKREFQDHSLETWTLYARLSPSCIPSIASAFEDQTRTYRSGNLLSSEIFDAAMSQPQHRDIYVPLLQSLIKVENQRHVDYDKYTTSALESLQNSKDINEPSSLAWMQVMELALTMNSLPQVEPSRHNHNFKFGEPYVLSDVKLEQFCDTLLNLNDINRVEVAGCVCRILILLTQTDQFLHRVAQSKVMLLLLAFSRSLDRQRGTMLSSKSPSSEQGKKNQETYDLFHNALIVLFRRCFENSQFLKVAFLAELSEPARTLARSKRDMRFLLRESSQLIFRLPVTFAEVFSERYRLHNYEGDEITPTTLSVYRLPDEEVKKSEEKETLPDPSLGEKTLQSTGLVHVLISELMALSKTDWYSDPVEEEPKKETKTRREFEVFKNPNFSYACFLLQTLTELLSSYKDAKLEFLTFSKKKASDLKPRSTALNFLLHQLLPSHSLQLTKGSEADRRMAISSITRLAILGLVSTPLGSESEPTNEDVDMALIRKFFVDVFSKTFLETPRSAGSVEQRYGKLIDQCELCGSLVSAKFRESAEPLLDKGATKHDQYFIARVFMDNGIPQLVTSLLGELDLNFPQIHKVMKACLKPVTLLGKIKTDQHELFDGEAVDKDDDEDVPVEMEEGDETPDLFKNSTLGMYDVEDESEDDMEYYDENQPIEMLMSGEEISDEDGELDSDEGESSSGIEDSELDDDAEMDEMDDMDEMDEDDIEIIDELGLEAGDSESEHLFDEEEYSEDFSDLSGEYEGDYDGELLLGSSDDESGSDYDEEELDGWIDAFENDAGDVPGDRANALLDRSDLGLDLGSSLSDGPLAVEVDIEEPEDDPDASNDTVRHTARVLRTLDGRFMSLLDNMVPGRNENHVLFSDLFTRAGRNGRGSFNIGSHDRNAQFDRAFDSLIEMLSRPKRASEAVQNDMYLKSTSERWDDTYKMFKEEVSSGEIRVVPAILNRIEQDSLELNAKREETARRQREEREEKMRKKAEEERILREKEAREREERQNALPPREPIMVAIGDRDVDISGTDIDPEFFEALPDDMREEVFTQHIRERRANASTDGGESREIDPDFLDALPDNIRNEILQQELMARRFSGLSDPRFDSGDIDDEEDDDMHTAHSIVLPSSLEGAPRVPEPVLKAKKTYVTLLMGRLGVAAVIRLLFVPQLLVKRECIYQALHYICNNKQSRTDVMNYLVALLYDGLNTRKPLDKLMALVDSRVTPEHTSTKRVSGQDCPVSSTPVTLALQIIEAIDYLLERNNHVRFYVCKEHENPFMSKKSHHRLKSLAHLLKESKYPINLLLRLLESSLIRDNQPFLDILARVLQMSTKAISAFVRTKVDKSASLPYVPGHNASQVIKILTARDCPNATFMRTIGAMQNMSVLPNARKTFSMQLSDSATALGTSIMDNLHALGTKLGLSKDIGLEMAHSELFAQFSAPGSDQAKLLRILTALDYMFESKAKDETVDEVEELTGLYKQLALGSLWDALSECLLALEGLTDTFQIATALLPLIESLMVVCKHSRVNELQIKDVTKYEARRVDYKKEPIESLFFSFTDQHKKILNQMVRTNPNLMSGPFGMLIRNPRVLEFDNKKNYFDRKLHEDRDEHLRISISVRRDQVFLDSYRALFFKSKEEVKKSKLEISFKGESGVDAGGVTREWYQVLSRQMFNPDYALFTPVASDETTFHPNRTSFVNPEHLSFFKFIGMVIGKAIYDGNFLDCHFSRAVYKRLLGRPVSLKDMETLDDDYFKSLMWMLENDITDVITEDFSVETDDYGEHKVIDLVENGHNIPVTEENKNEYVKLLVEYRLQTSVKEQMDNFLAGFHEMIPADLVLIFDEQELELLISGLPDIDIDDWKSHTEYNNYSPSAPQIQWFWRAVKSFDNEERAKLLQFATGTSKVPLNGFKELSGSNGVSKFSIHRDYGPTDRLPSSHTCFNQIDLPAYETYETLRGSLLLAFTEGHEGFGLA